MCPRCLEPHERAIHVLFCQDPRTKAIWQQEMVSLQTWLRKEKTEPDLARYLLKSLRFWREDKEMVYPLTMPPTHPLRQALDNQTSIGWYNLFLGRATRFFAPIQSLHYTQLKRRSTGDAWTARLIVRLWDTLWVHWEHRNGILHSPQHPWKVAKKQALWTTIEQHLELGIDALLPQHQYLLRYSEQRMQSWTIQQQQRWLDSVQSARALFTHDQEALHPTNTVLDEWMQQDAADAANPDPATQALTDPLDDASLDDFLASLVDEDDDAADANAGSHSAGPEPPVARAPANPPTPDPNPAPPDRLYDPKVRRKKKDKEARIIDRQRRIMSNFLQPADLT